MYHCQTLLFSLFLLFYFPFVLRTVISLLLFMYVTIRLPQRAHRTNTPYTLLHRSYLRLSYSNTNGSPVAGSPQLSPDINWYPLTASVLDTPE
ncbi:hypothetical protein JB92DRAFT_795838 [Gautieria morchelliformis]|nr:hypothetical protein JB92DRAFT_795838 [Gautieria morchelliformis]